MHRKSMRLTCALAALLAIAPLSTPARAEVGDPPVGEDSALGGWMAIGCGVFVRASIATGFTQVGTIAGAVACCGYMLFDAYVSSVNHPK